MALVGYALPVLPGEEARVASFGERLDAAGLRADYEELNRRAGVTQHLEWIQPTPVGSLRVTVFESATPERLGRPLGDSRYDRWWRDEVKAAHGFDPADVADPGLRLSWSWSAGG